MFFCVYLVEFCCKIQIQKVLRDLLSKGEWFIPKISRTKHVVTGSSQQTKQNLKLVLKLICFNSGESQMSKRPITKQ